MHVTTLNVVMTVSDEMGCESGSGMCKSGYFSIFLEEMRKSHEEHKSG